ncbi:MAG: bifunctional diaminohydroxyphosphoribosylaminopyrimidine deaminase/5-amino-6-(5-phosphoribosylamino)uracil reductase RibD [Firmicutes bacterium]|nr:bifunctional diaminohydroxyphosphoribosylaminopyrimidine deaminase/5-amino-6-(5-phosphoribosylamino)uracil reductase RibD [Bacillota bacterium]
MNSDEKWMKKVFKLARRGRGGTSPNPQVGALVIREGEPVGSGYHRVAGGPHAEVVALGRAGERARGATLYVNLEPCSHRGRTPPCVDLIISAGIARVVAALEDPNPRVSGQGFKRLREAGIAVKTGVLAAEARRLNEIYLKFITTGRPFLAIKAALTLDGKIATAGGDSRWITGERSRRYVHTLRDRFDAIMVGLGTALKDDPRLTTRFAGGRDGVRIVVDSRARLPRTARLIDSSRSAPALLATTTGADPDRCRHLRERGMEILTLPAREGRVDLEALLKVLGERGLASVLVEGGGKLNYSLLEQGLVDKFYLFLAPLICGGREAPTAFDGAGVEKIRDAWRLGQLELKRFGPDLLLTGYPVKEGEETCLQE